MVSAADSLFALRAAARLASTALALWALLAGGAAVAQPASDRDQPMVVTADRSATLDLQRQTLVYSGNVVVTQGSMVLRAVRIELREDASGYRSATAHGAAGRPATWRQRRGAAGEMLHGEAARIDFDGRSDTLRLIGDAAVRRLRGDTVADEITGTTIVWDNAGEVFRVEGGSTPGGRVRAVLTPRPKDGAAATPSPAAPLQPSRALESRP